MTTLRCSRTNGTYSMSRCHRQPVTQWQPEGRYGDDESKTRATLDNLLCNFHAGHRKRRSYSNTVHTLTDEDRVRLLPLQAAKDEQARVEQEKRAEAAAIARAERIRNEWAAQGTAYEHLLTDRDSRYNDPENPTLDGYVYPAADKPERLDRPDYRFVEVSARVGFAVMDDARAYPYSVQMTSAKGLTPNEARAVAALLVEAAAKAEELNAKGQP